MSVTFDMSKVVYMTRWYENQHGHRRNLPPEESTFGIPIKGPNAYAACHSDFPFETNFERATRLEILDYWTTKVKVTFSASRSLIFSGKKAWVIWEAWNARIFGKKNNE